MGANFSAKMKAGSFDGGGGGCPNGQSMITDDSGAAYCEGAVGGGGDPNEATPGTPPTIYNNPANKQQGATSTFDTSLNTRTVNMGVSPLHL